jgi:glycosyltransferase involved in cell wall biosynthesis
MQIKFPLINEKSWINPYIWRILSDNKPDIIIVGGYYHLTMLLAIFWACIHNVPYIINSESHFLTKRNNVKLLIKRLLLATIIKRASAYLPAGKYAGEYLVHYGADPEKIFYFPNTPDVEFFIKESNEYRRRKKNIKENLGIDSKNIILYVGRLVKEKGLFILLEAFKEVKKNYEDLTLLLVGEGILKDSLIRYAQNNELENVYFAGFIPNNKLPKYYAISDIFILPSYYEPWGVVVNEAMASGLPIILSDKVGAAGDLLKEGENGFSFKSGNWEELAELIKKLLANPDKIAKMGDMYRRIIEGFDYSYCEENLKKAINKCIKDI